MTREESILALKPYVDRVAFRYRGHEDAVQEARLGAVQVADGKYKVGRIHGRARDFFRQGWDKQGGRWTQREFVVPCPEPSYSTEPWKRITCDELIGCLPRREAQLILLYYFSGMTVASLQSVFHVNESRVSQLHQRALRTMRERAGV